MSIQEFVRQLKAVDDSTVVWSDQLSEVDSDHLQISPPESNAANVDVLQEKESTKITLNLTKTATVPPKTEANISAVEQLFLASHTATDKKAIWLDYYEKAKKSKKTNSVANSMRAGRFMITDDDKILILPQYDVTKSTADILKDKWLK